MSTSSELETKILEDFLHYFLPDGLLDYFEPVMAEDKEHQIKQDEVYKREAQAEINREMRRYKKRGRKATRRNAPFRPPVLSNGDTLVELLTRSKHALTQTHDKWSERQQARMRLLFQMYPKLKEPYDIVNKLRSIFRCKVFD